MRMPTQWPRRRVDDVSYPLVLPSVRAAAVDGAGRLWVAMPTSHVYVFDTDGEKVRTLQLSALAHSRRRRCGSRRTGDCW